jgi:O-antigen ligase/polysaccharide polymerase Wzy-like membrane protein
MSPPGAAAQHTRPAPWWGALALGVWAAAIGFRPMLALPLAAALLIWWTLRTPVRWLALFLGTALLLPPLPIPIGDSGPHPSLIFAALGLVAGVLWMGQWRIAANSLQLAFVALFGVLLASVGPAAFYSGWEAAGGSLARVALFGISVYLFFYCLSGPARDVDAARSVRLLYMAAVVAALFACVDFYFQFPAPAGYGPQFVWLDSGVFRRAQGLFYEASTLGNFCAFFLVMIAVAFSRAREESPVARKWLALGAAVFLAALVVSYSRASLINVGVALAVLLWRNRRRVRMSRVLAVAAAGAVVTWLVFPVFVEAYLLRLSRSAEFFFSATEGVLSGRVASWRTLVDWAMANPWRALTGIGYKTLPYTDYLGAPVVADNMYLSLLVETGVAGLAALVWLNVAIMRALLRARESLCSTWMLCFWAGEIVQMASGDLLTYWRVLPVYFFVLALALRV